MSGFPITRPLCSKVELAIGKPYKGDAINAQAIYKEVLSMRGEML